MVLRLLTLYNEFATKNFEKYDDDDIVDKMSRKFSAIMMLIFAFGISTAQLVGEPFKCWCQNELSDSRCEYITTFCYITSQYIPLSNDTNIPAKSKLLSHKIDYYQWVVFIYLFQAMLFYFPCIIWRWLNTKSGIAIRNYIQELRTNKSVVQDNPAVQYVASHLQLSLLIRKNYRHRGAFKGLILNRSRFSFVNTSYLFTCHILVKILYAAIALLQIIIINYWLRDHHYPIDSRSMLFGTHSWKLAERFPRMILCSLDVFIQMFDKQMHWIQCTLPLNIYIEKIYLIVWYWLWVLFLLTLFSIVTSIGKALPFYRRKFIYNRLTKKDDNKPEELYRYLGLDGALVLTLLSSNTNDVNVTAILDQLSTLKDKQYK